MPKKEKKVTWEHSGIFHNVENAKDRIWETDPNLEMNRTIFQGLGKMHCILSYELYDNEKLSTVKTTLYKFLWRTKTLILHVSNVLECTKLMLLLLLLILLYIHNSQRNI